jgi:hypothetical protein
MHMLGALTQSSLAGMERSGIPVQCSALLGHEFVLLSNCLPPGTTERDNLF